MLDRSPFPQLLAPRLGKLHERIKDRLWTLDPEPLPIAQSKPTREHRPISDAGRLDYRAITRTPHLWGKMFDQCFWTLDLRGRRTKGRYLHWVDQGEATVYAGQSPLFGFDPGHHYQPLPGGMSRLTVESICCRSGIWVSGETQGVTNKGSRFEGAFLADRDDDAWSMLHDLEVLLGLATQLIERDTPAKDALNGGGYREPFEAAAPLAKRIIHRLNDAADAFDRDGAAAGAKATKAIIKELTGQGDPTVRLLLTGHAHIDLVWLWPENVAEFKACHSFSNVLSLMDRYPELVFGYSQPASYDAIERRAPRLMKAINQRIKAKRFEHAGATYVESDTQLPCGEALLRSFEIGQDECARRFGKPSNVLWIPDVFGYSACVPQIMTALGVDYFYTTKQAWSNATKFPYSSFRWRGHDGSEVLTHVSFTHYNQETLPVNLRFFADHHRQAGVHDEALMPTGYGDGGGGPTASMLEHARRSADLAGLPQTKWGRIDGFFERLAAHRDNLPTWQGEMYLEFHRGVQTTHCNLKEAFRAAERGLQAQEAANAVLGRGTIDVQSWKRLIFAQFHDYIPGTSIQRVYDEGVPELQAIADAGRDDAAKALATGRGGEACLFNPLPTPVVVRQHAELVALPALSGVAAKDAPRVTGKVEATKIKLQSDRVRATFNARGEISRFTVDGQDIAIDQPLGQAWSFPDHPSLYDAWDIDRHSLSNGTHEKRKPTVKVVGDGKTIACVAFTRPIAKASTMTVRYRLFAGSPVLRMDVELDWQDPQTLLKLVFPTDYRGQSARYGAPFGSTLRPQQPGPLVNDARFEVPGSRWATVADDTEAEGLMLMTEARYGFGCASGKLHVSVVRSAKITQPRDGGSTTTLVSTGGPLKVSDLGKHTARFALGRFTADAPRSEQPAALAESLFTAPVAYTGKPTAAAPFTLDAGDSLIPSWIKPMDNGAMLLRLHETLGRRGRTTLQTAPDKIARLADPRGNPTSKPTSKLAINFTPYQLLTVRLDPA